MKVEPISNGNLRIWLSEEEMEKREGDAWLCLRRMLETAQAQLSRLGKHILAELIPVAGGCVVLISTRRNAHNTGISVYRIQNVGALFRLAEQWASHLPDEQTNAHTSLYETDEGYALAVYPVSKLTRQQVALLREFGTLIGRGEVAVSVAAERGRLLLAGDALEKLLIT